MKTATHVDVEDEDFAIASALYKALKYSRLHPEQFRATGEDKDFEALLIGRYPRLAPLLAANDATMHAAFKTLATRTPTASMMSLMAVLTEPLDLGG